MLEIYCDRFDIVSNARDIINPFKDSWVNNDTTNCYAYALGIDIYKSDNSSIYFNPGYFSGLLLNNYFNERKLLSFLMFDLDKFGLNYVRVPHNYILKNGEWKIAIFGGFTDSKNEYDDFHFLRQTKSGIWTHKQGYYSKPINYDSDGIIITNPTSCRIEDNTDGEITRYKYLKTLCLSK